MIDRPAVRARLEQALSRSRVVALVGPRQCGKTTMARQLVAPDSQVQARTGVTLDCGGGGRSSEAKWAG